VGEHLEYHSVRARRFDALPGRFPEVGIELREETSQIIIDGIREGLTDLGVFSGHIDSGDLETRPYRHDTLMVILPANHPLESSERLKLADIAPYDNVGLPGW